MSDSEKEDTKPAEKTKKKAKFSICTLKKLRSSSEKEVFAYISDLHDKYRKHERKLKKYKDKVKYLNKIVQKLERKLKVMEKSSSSSHALDSKVVVDSNGRGEKEKESDDDPEAFLKGIREAAEEAQNCNGFIYEPTSGLYYDKSTGYYYNAEYGLYYDGNTGCYYKYDQDRNEFEFHSQVAVEGNDIDKAQDKPRKNRKRRKCRRSDDEEPREQEDGELPSNSSEDESVDDEVAVNNHYEDIAKKYPPSLRLVVQDTNLEKLKIGTLYLITFKGGTLGREGDHDVIIPDVNVSKYHLKLTYNEDKDVYQCVDLGSRNGTLLNGKRMSTGKQESELMDVVHGSIIQIGQTRLLCHTHSGNSTCGQCEPGLLVDTRTKTATVAPTTHTHKEQLKKLQKKYGLENEKYVDAKKDSNYKDRAATRRETVGSTTEKEKTEVASVNTEISSKNKGFQMLSKLGWNKGETLGKTKEGILEPIPLSTQDGKKGLGCEATPKVAQLSKTELQKIKTWRKAQQRYNELKTADVFDSDSD